MLRTVSRRAFGPTLRAVSVVVVAALLVQLLSGCGAGRARTTSHRQLAHTENISVPQQYRTLLFGSSTSQQPGLSGASGSRDLSFGNTGFVTVPYGQWGGAAATAVETDGKIVAAGETRLDGRKEIIVTRMNPDGSLDLSFGLLGITTVDIGGDAAVDSGAAIALEPDGKIVIAGTGRVDKHLTFAAIRLDPNGSLDSTFGSGGIVTVPIGKAAIATAVVVEPSGRIVLGGSTRTSGVLDFAAAALNPDGSLDHGFGSDGVAILRVQGGAWGMVAMPDGSFVLGGQGAYQGTQAYVAVRILADGSLDRAFGHSGTVTLPMGTYAIGQAIALTASGNIVLTGDARTTAGGEIATVELRPNGALAESFGSHGIAVFRGWGVNAVAVDSSGRIVLAGTGVAVVRLDADGSVDPSFGSAGRVIDGVGSAAAANGVALDGSNGRYVLAGAAKVDGKAEILVMKLWS